jgi:hypothetical protein
VWCDSRQGDVSATTVQEAEAVVKAAKGVRRAKRKSAPFRDTDDLGKSPTGRVRRYPDIPIPGVDFKSHIHRLLKLADVVETEDVVANLNSCLGNARAHWDLGLETKKIRIPASLLKKLETSIRGLKGLLRSSENYLGSQRFRFIQCPVGEGTVATQTFESGKWGEIIPFPPEPLPPPDLHEKIPHGGMIAAINIPRTLDRMQCQIKIVKGRRARPREQGKRDVVAYAALFFHEHSTVEATSYPGGPFATFCRSFYEAVTGIENPDRDVLQTQIKAEVKKPTFGIQTLQKSTLESSID